MLPKPNDGFAWVQAAAGPALVCESVQPLADHLFTTRAWALGSARAGADDEPWTEVARAIGVEPAMLVRVRQVHGAAVLVLRRGDTYATDQPREADIIASDDPSRALAIQTADCVPLLVADRRTGAVAAAHAGWRGLAARVPEMTVARLTREFDSRPADLVAVIGPSISACCYEVGAEVRDAFASGGFPERDLGRWFFSGPRPSERNPSMPGLRAPRPQHWFFDGWGAARYQLEAAGVPPDQIVAADLCSASHAQWLCSYRRDGKNAGRMAAVIRPHDTRRL